MERAAYASDPARSRGRQFPASESPTRSEFQRDRDRIVHSAAFRRLQYKTQVFLRHQGQHFRTRLTHTLEVSQMARSIARALMLDEDLAEAVALAHDLGHTPFGHAGERILHEKMGAWGGFDHNLQAIRVVTSLESRYAAHDGLNLTWESLEGILKHNGPVVANPPGLDLEPHTHAGLEAQVAAIADDIAYDAHDIDDALRAGLITIDDLGDVPIIGPIVREVRGLWPNLERRRFAHELQRRLITRLVEDVIATTAAAIADAAPQSVEDVRALDRSLVAFSPEVAAAEHGLKRFMFERVYRSEPVMVLVRRAETLLGELFDAYMAGAPLTGRWSAAVAAAPDAAARARIICDYVAGMTDPFAEERHAALVTAK